MGNSSQKYMGLVCGLLVSLTGCVTAPANPAEVSANKAAGLEYAVRSCSGFVGGFSDIKELREMYNKEIVTARALGVTEEMLAQSKRDVATVFNTTAVFTSHQEACGTLLASLAWES